ncbi:MAG: acyl carrier protein [Paludibacteraceae bacterium]|nr:acyl carrier protein [Paludibacteraceae bacterium]MBR1786041.1 acyl carrier protein [Paludibacteraceae bacterium]
MADYDIRVIAIIADKLGVDPSTVTPEADIQSDLGADSLDTVEMIMEFEKEFGIQIPEEETERIKTVGDAIAYVEEAKAKAEAEKEEA